MQSKEQVRNGDCLGTPLRWKLLRIAYGVASISLMAVCWMTKAEGKKECGSMKEDGSFTILKEDFLPALRTVRPGVAAYKEQR